MISKRISDLLPAFRKYFQNMPVLRAWLFGSYSRGEETTESDIDILVDYDRTNGRVSLLKMGGMLMDLSEIAGCKVDLVDNRGLMDFARKSVDNDKILIYERSN
ncbi:MAG: nucleotidyltransferase [Bacteroides sp.]|nr:nucleotidyltransferase [Bacteroides sp.]